MKGKWVALLSGMLVTTGCSNSNGGQRQSEAASSSKPVLTAEAMALNTAKANAKSAVMGMLKDPESAHFTDLRAFKLGTSTVVCGYVNAKNSFGGYVGKKPFYVDKGENYYRDKALNGRPHMIQDENSFDLNEWRSLCDSDNPKRN